MAAAAHVADIIKGGLETNLEAPGARGIAAQLGLDVSDQTASRALSLLAAGPLAGYYIAATPHTPARLLLADLVAAGAAVTPAARVRLPLSIPAVSGTTPASSGSEQASYREVHEPRIDRTRAVVNKAPLPPKNPDQARALLPAGAQLARTFELVVSAWRVSPAWGAGSVADVARSLAPDELWAGQEQLQRALRSMVRVGVLRCTNGGLEFAWQRWRGDAVLAAALMAGEGGVQVIDRHGFRELQRLAREQGQRALPAAREQERSAQAAHDVARREIAERVHRAELVLAGLLDGPDELAAQVTDSLHRSSQHPDWFRGDPRTAAKRALEKHAASALRQHPATADLAAACAAVARCFEVPAMPESASERMIAGLERWGLDARCLTRADAIKL